MANEKGETVDTTAAQKRESKRKKLQGIAPNKLLEKILELNEDSTQNAITQTCRDSLYEAVKWHWKDIQENPLEMFRKGVNHPKLINCAKCTIPKVFHTDPSIPCQIKDELDSDIALEIEMSVPKIQCAELLWDTILEKDQPKQVENKYEKQQDVQPHILHETKRTPLPQFSKKRYANWSSNVMAWDERYANAHPLDKFFDLIHALEKSDDGKDVSDKLQLEIKNKKASNIIELCLDKLAEYLDVNSITKANEVMADWQNFKRESNESMKDYIERFEHLKRRREDAN